MGAISKDMHIIEEALKNSSQGAVSRIDRHELFYINRKGSRRLKYLLMRDINDALVGKHSGVYKSRIVKGKCLSISDVTEIIRFMNVNCARTQLF